MFVAIELYTISRILGKADFDPMQVHVAGEAGMRGSCLLLPNKDGLKTLSSFSAPREHKAPLCCLREAPLGCQEKRHFAGQEKRHVLSEAQPTTLDPAPKKRRKYLTTAAEEKAHWEAKAKRRAGTKDAEKSTSKAEIKPDAGVKKEKDSTSMRAMALRLYPSLALTKGLLRWLDIADALDAHVKDALEAFAAGGEKASFRYLRDEHICLTSAKLKRMEKDGTLDQLRDLERRRSYMELPLDVQQAIVNESVANFTANQTNLEKGHNKGFETRSRESSRRWKTLKFLATGMCVKQATGEVIMYPQSDFVDKDADRGMYIKDRLVAFLCPTRRDKKGRESRVPTKHWGNHLQCGKNKGGRAFTIRYDTLGKKWYLILSYDARVKGAPLRESAYVSLRTDTRASAKRARKWIERQDLLFNSPAVRGNMCSIDPGSRTPWTCFDAHRKGFYDVYPDLVATLANHHNNIARIQSRAAPCVPKEGSRSREKRRKKRHAKGSSNRKRKRNYRRSCNRLMNDKYDLMKTTVRQAHNAFANHLVRAYDVIIMPEFMTAGMVRKRRQLLKLPGMKESDSVNGPREGMFTLHKTTRKAMRWISHFAFRQRLFAKAMADPHQVKDVICTTEEYTTKQCPYCDFVHHKIGSSKVFKCGNENCRFVGRRDNVGAFNIGLRSIVKGEVREVL